MNKQTKVSGAVCTQCKTKQPTTRKRKIRTKKYMGPCGDSFCFASCDLVDVCFPTSITVCEGCASTMGTEVKGGW